MSNENFNAAGHLQTMRIIVLALVMGLATFTGIAVFIGQSQEPTGAFVLTLVAPIFFLVTVGFSFMMPILMEKQFLQASMKSGKGHLSAQELAMLFQSRLVVSAALVEGPGFLGCIAYIVEHRPLVLVIPALAISLLLLKIPSADQLGAFIENKQRDFEDLRSRGTYV